MAALFWASAPKFFTVCVRSEFKTQFCSRNLFLRQRRERWGNRERQTLSLSNSVMFFPFRHFNVILLLKGNCHDRHRQSSCNFLSLWPSMFIFFFYHFPFILSIKYVNVNPLIIITSDSHTTRLKIKLCLVKSQVNLHSTALFISTHLVKIHQKVRY